VLRPRSGAPTESGENEAVTAILLLSCPDQTGVVAATAQFLVDHHGNIVHAERLGMAVQLRFSDGDGRKTVVFS
jgi:hypothetical protein